MDKHYEHSHCEGFSDYYAYTQQGFEWHEVACNELLDEVMATVEAFVTANPDKEVFLTARYHTGSFPDDDGVEDKTSVYVSACGFDGQPIWEGFTRA